MVTIHGLQSQPQLNGALAKCLHGPEADPEGRVAVQLADGRALRIKTSNFTVAGADDEADGGEAEMGEANCVGGS